MTNKTTPKDFFMHLAATVALYVVAIALINLTFSTINYAFPDALAGYFNGNSIKWPIAMLIILAPTLYIIEWLINRDLHKMPEKGEIWIRRWRIYLTLFLSGVTILGTLVTLLYYFLDGEITVRFVYKVLVMLVVAGVIFAYYILDKKSGENGGNTVAKKTLYVAGLVIVLAAIVAGFVVVGSPQKQRAMRYDERRVSDLSGLQYQIVNYWQTKGRMPASLDELNDSLGYKVPVDPKNNTAYEYIRGEGNNFSLCATFELPNENKEGRGSYNGSGSATMSYPTRDGTDSWNHAAGRVCFERNIDPERYPVLPKSRI